MDTMQSKRRVKANHKTGTVYNPKENTEAEKVIADAWTAVNGDGFKTYEGAVELRVWFKREVAKREPKRKVGSYQLQKPDVDNVAKLVMDALNGVAYADDVQVNSLQIRRDLQWNPGSRANLCIELVYLEEVEQV